MRSFDPSLFILAILAALAALVTSPAQSQETLPQDLQAPEAEPERAPEAARPAAPVAPSYVSAETGLVVGFPAGWSSSQAVDETRLPGLATYRWEHGAGRFAGALLIVERVTGLNPLMEERWRRGRVGYGYHGMEPTALVPEEAMIYGAGAGLALASGDRVGRAYFVQRGQVFWAVHVSAPASTLADVPRLLDALARGVRLSDKETPVEATASR